MKKSRGLLFLFILLGLVGGALLGRWLDAVPGLSFLTQTATVSGRPAMDLLVFSFDLQLTLDISLLSIAGAAAAIWLYRKV